MPTCRAEVVASAAGTLLVRRTAACSDCGGCGGRCNLFLSDEAATLSLPLASHDAAPAPGTAVLLSIDDSWLLRSAWRGYGLPLLGMLAGAALGHGLAVGLGMPPDLPALLLALLGTFAAFSLSNSTEPQIAVRSLEPRQ